MNDRQVASSKSSGQASRWPTALVGIILAAGFSFVSHAKAESNDVDKILKNMSDYITNHKTLIDHVRSDIEVITPNLQAIQFTSSGRLHLSRPDELRAVRTGLYGCGDRIRWEDVHRANLHSNVFRAEREVNLSGPQR